MTRPTVILNGGFGNQMFQLAKAIDLSFESEVALNCVIGETKNRFDAKPYLLDYRLPDNIFLDFEDVNPLVKKGMSVALRLRLKNCKRSPSRFFLNVLTKVLIVIMSILQPKISKLVIPPDLGYYEPTEESTNSVLFGYFQTHKWKNSEYVERTLYELQNLNKRDVVEEYEKKSNLEKPLVLHIRLGDYRREPTFGILGLDYFEEALSTAFKVADFSSIWLFSDEPDEAVRMIPSKYLHKVRIIPEIEGSPTLTYEVMRLGHGYILSNSTFGWWAAFLSKCSPRIVVAPKPWFIGISEPNELIPSPWVKIGRK